jgi:hypothetical protein
MYGWRETWSLASREKQSLKGYENRMSRRIFGPKSEDVTGDWRKMHSEQSHNLYSSPDIVRVIKSRRTR